MHPNPAPRTFAEWLDEYLLGWPAPAVVVVPWVIPLAFLDLVLLPFRRLLG